MALLYVGPHAPLDVPARDLDDADLASIAFDRLPREERPESRADTPTDALRDELIASGLYIPKTSPKREARS